MTSKVGIEGVVKLVVDVLIKAHMTGPFPHRRVLGRLPRGVGGVAATGPGRSCRRQPPVCGHVLPLYPKDGPAHAAGRGLVQLRRVRGGGGEGRAVELDRVAARPLPGLLRRHEQVHTSAHDGRHLGRAWAGQPRLGRPSADVKAPRAGRAYRALRWLHGGPQAGHVRVPGS